MENCFLVLACSRYSNHVSEDEKMVQGEDLHANMNPRVQIPSTYVMKRDMTCAYDPSAQNGDLETKKSLGLAGQPPCWENCDLQVQ